MFQVLTLNRDSERKNILAVWEDLLNLVRSGGICKWDVVALPFFPKHGGLRPECCPKCS